jgi:hypothetical protein
MSESGFGAQQAIGWLLMVLAGLWLVLTGGCTAVFLVMGLGSLVSPAGDGLGMLPLVLFCGAIGIGPGVLVFWAGRQLTKPKPTPIATPTEKP